MDFFGPQNVNLFFQLFLAAFLGAVIGLEREYQGKAAGLRTYTLVALGACLFTIVSAHGFGGVAGSQSFDPSRIASQVVVGVGFLGAGLIFLKGEAVYGLTTAAGLWISAALGVAVGAGLYSAAVFSAFIALVVLVTLRAFEKRFIRPKREGSI
ncbi:MAG: MgtC/SapB family protein [Candidatus Niyogibacteria bacterium]|nr:MgtC/SapB family protein [Candidatus Niyogibacteria bacterium]